MNVTFILISIAIILRASGVVLSHRRASIPLLQMTGWMFRLLGTWVLVAAFGAWAPLWPVGVITILMVVAGSLIKNAVIVTPLVAFLADLMVVVVSGLISVPPFDATHLLIAALTIPLITLMLDHLVIRLQHAIHPKTFVLVGILFLLLAVVVAPFSLHSVIRTIENRFAYLLSGSEFSYPSPTLPDPDAITSAMPLKDKSFDHFPQAVIVSLDQRNGSQAATTYQWRPYIEWRLSNPSFDGNPFDLIASATFVHPSSGKSHTTGMFYAGGDTWCFRFTGTQAGEWNFSTKSDDPELSGYKGSVFVQPNPGAAGFIMNHKSKWMRSGTERAFVPQFVMIGGPHTYYQKTEEIGYIIQTFIMGHGFNGVHTPVFCRWFDMEKDNCTNINVIDPNPDMKTFEALETLISRIHFVGGVVHIWMWGDDSRGQNPKRWGLNQTADLRLQRYIGARLGPLPGWTLGYGYDLFEWVSGEQLAQWYSYMHNQMGWRHLLGARSNKNRIDQLTEVMDYASYEQHRPDYETYVLTIDARPNKPAFSEDRFRLRHGGRKKDYTLALTRRGLWQSTMAGGVANIWGNLIGAPGANGGYTVSAPYPDPDVIRTYFTFWENRFYGDMERCNDLSSALCLKRTTQSNYIFYQEDSEAIEFDLTEMEFAQSAIAVDTCQLYKERSLGKLTPGKHFWEAPYPSDWAIAVGDFPN